MNEPTKVPDSIARIPVSAMKLAEVKKLERAAWRLMEALDAAKKDAPEVGAERERLRQLWSHLHDGVKWHELKLANREAVLWTVFVPEKWHTKEVVRTLHYRIIRWWHDQYVYGESNWTIDKFRSPGQAHAEKAVCDDPWREFARLSVPKEAQVAA